VWVGFSADVRLVPEKTILTMRLVGGHPVLDLVNTVDARRGRWGPDLLAGYGDALLWAERVGLVGPAEVGAVTMKSNDRSAADRALARIVAARERLYEILLAEAEGRSPTGDDHAWLAELVRQAAACRTLSPDADGRFSWTWCDDMPDAILHRVAFAAAELLTNRNRRRITVCAGLNCGWLFLDRSRAGRRRWCSEEGCGSHSRIRRFRSKSPSEIA